MGEGTPGTVLRPVEVVWVCKQGIVMILLFSFQFNLTSFPLPIFPCRMAVGEEGGVSELPWIFCKL